MPNNTFAELYISIEPIVNILAAITTANKKIYKSQIHVCKFENNNNNAQRIAMKKFTKWIEYEKKSKTISSMEYQEIVWWMFTQLKIVRMR